MPKAAQVVHEDHPLILARGAQDATLQPPAR